MPGFEASLSVVRDISDPTNRQAEGVIADLVSRMERLIYLAVLPFFLGLEKCLFAFHRQALIHARALRAVVCDRGSESWGSVRMVRPLNLK